jgi:hypothetical protein
MICSICTATAIECKATPIRLCLTCAYNKADAIKVAVEPMNLERSAALVTQDGSPIAVIHWPMGRVELRTEFQGAPSGDLERIPEIALPYVADQMRNIQADLAYLERP